MNFIQFVATILSQGPEYEQQFQPPKVHKPKRRTKRLRAKTPPRKRNQHRTTGFDSKHTQRY